MKKNIRSHIRQSRSYNDSRCINTKVDTLYNKKAEDTSYVTKAVESKWRKAPDNSQWKSSAERSPPIHQDELMRCSVLNSTSYIKCFYTNTNSLIQKIDELRYLIEINKYDIVAVTETWAHTEIRDTVTVY